MKKKKENLLKSLFYSLLWLHCDFFNLKAWHFWHPNYLNFLSFLFTAYYLMRIRASHIDRKFNLFIIRIESHDEHEVLNRKCAIFNMSSIHHNISHECKLILATSCGFPNKINVFLARKQFRLIRLLEKLKIHEIR